MTRPSVPVRTSPSPSASAAAADQSSGRTASRSAAVAPSSGSARHRRSKAGLVAAIRPSTSVSASGDGARVSASRSRSAARRDSSSAPLTLAPSPRVAVVEDLPGRAVDDADRSHPIARGQTDRHPGVEADAGRPDDQRVVGEAIVSGRVQDDERLVAEDRVPAERDLARRLRDVETDAGLEPLAIAVDQRDQADRHLEELPRQPDDGVEVGLRRRVEEAQRRQRVQPESVVLGNRRGLHADNLRRCWMSKTAWITQTLRWSLSKGSRSCS
jgi:hypothetical protein